MSFVRVNVAGWSVGDLLTSAQQNQLDIDHARAGQFHPAGFVDTIETAITVSTGIVTFAAAGTLQLSALGAGQVTVAGALQGVTANAIQGTVANGISAAFAGGISDGGVTAGIKATTPSGVQTTAVGGIQLAGGLTDFITYSAGKPVQIDHQLTAPCPSSTFGAGNDWKLPPDTGILCATGPTASLPGKTLIVPLLRMMNGHFNGATLIGAALHMNVTASHSGVPANLPAMDVFRMPVGVSGNPTPTQQSLFSVSPQRFPNPGSGAAWFSSGNMQALSTLPNQNNVIDLAAYNYYLSIVEEAGANSIGGNQYWDLFLTFSGVINNGPD